jgi:hypothetical protein
MTDGERTDRPDDRTQPDAWSGLRDALGRPIARRTFLQWSGTSFAIGSVPLLRRPAWLPAGGVDAVPFVPKPVLTRHCPAPGGLPDAGSSRSST